MGKNVTRQLVHFHLPKSGGKTFVSMLKKQIFGHEPLIIRLTDAGCYAKNYQQRLQKADVITGHWNFNCVFPYIRKKHSLFMWIRDPVERGYSLYNYWVKLRRGSLPIVEKIWKEKWTLDEFFSKHNEDKDVWLFCGMSLLGLENNRRASISQIVKKAKDNYKYFDFIGLTEDYENEMIRFGNEFGFNIEYENTNVTPDWAKTPMTEEQRERFKKILEPEYEIYEYGKELVNAHKSRM